MKRILMVLTVALVMVVMMAVMAGNAFAQVTQGCYPRNDGLALAIEQQPELPETASEQANDQLCRNV